MLPADLARIGQIVAWGGLVIVLAWVVAAFAVPGVRDSWLGSLGVSAGSNALLSTLVASLPAVLFAYCLWQAGRLFGALRGRAPFSPRAIESLVGLGWGAVATAKRLGAKIVRAVVSSGIFAAYATANPASAASAGAKPPPAASSV